MIFTEANILFVRNEIYVRVARLTHMSSSYHFFNSGLPAAERSQSHNAVHQNHDNQLGLAIKDAEIVAGAIRTAMINSNPETRVIPGSLKMCNATSTILSKMHAQVTHSAGKCDIRTSRQEPPQTCQTATHLCETSATTTAREPSHEFHS